MNHCSEFAIFKAPKENIPRVIDFQRCFSMEMDKSVNMYGEKLENTF